MHLSYMNNTLFKKVEQIKYKNRKYVKMDPIRKIKVNRYKERKIKVKVIEFLPQHQIDVANL